MATKPISMSLTSGEATEEPRLHAPYHPDPHHGEALFRQSKGHEREEYEEAEAYASPDDVNPEIRARVERYGRSPQTKTEAHQPTSLGEAAEGASKSAATTAGEYAHTASMAVQDTAAPATETAQIYTTQAKEAARIASKASQERAGQVVEQMKEGAAATTEAAAETTQRMAEETKEQAHGLVAQACAAGRQAVRVTVERVNELLAAAKEAAGIPPEKPVTDAAKEAVGIPPEKPVGEALGEATEQAAEGARTAAVGAAEHVRRVTVEAIQATKGAIESAKESVATAPAAMKEFYEHGQKLAQGKDQQMAELGAREGAATSRVPSTRGRVMAETKEGGFVEPLIPPASTLRTTEAVGGSSVNSDVQHAPGQARTASHGEHGYKLALNPDMYEQRTGSAWRQMLGVSVGPGAGGGGASAGSEEAWRKAGAARETSDKNA